MDGYAEGGYVGTKTAEPSQFDRIEKTTSILEESCGRLLELLDRAFEPVRPSPEPETPADGRPRSQIVSRLAQLDQRLADLADRMRNHADRVDLP